MSGIIGGLSGFNPSQILQKIQERFQIAAPGGLNKADFKDVLGAAGKTPEQVDKVFNRLDTDSNGKVSQRELMSAIESRMNRLGEANGLHLGKLNHSPDAIVQDLLKNVAETSDDEETKSKINDLIKELQSGNISSSGIFKEIKAILEQHLPKIDVAA